MTNRFEIAREKAGEVVRTSWLAYLGFYGVAFERARPRVAGLAERAATVLDELVAKGETIEATAQERFEGVRERTQDFYATGLERVKGAMPSGIAANDRVKELEAEVEALNRKISRQAKPARKTTKTKTKAKAKAKAA